MPADRSHRVSDHGALPGSGALSEEQFDQLVALLDGQHAALVALLAPIHAIATQLLADRDAAKPEVKAAPDDPAANPGRSESEQGSA